MAAEMPLAEEAREFLYYVGLAITNWSHIDDRMFRLCRDILAPRSEQHAAVIYYRIQTLGGRLALVNDLVEIMLPKSPRKSGGHPPTISKTWRELLKDIKNALPLRNQLAHSKANPIAEQGDKPDGTFGIIDIYWSSYKSISESMQDPSKLPEFVKIDQIKTHITTINKLLIQIDDFRNEFSAQL